ncbi:ubiquitin family domain-containing protein [Ditylenchus destructor]|nr:ubiquitin family domain-containing protein [Ditylenchus destructor]
MFRCGQCSENFENESAIRRHLSISHLRYFPYLCNLCEKSGEIYSTATEDDMNEHVDKKHPGNETSFNVVKVRDTESKLKVLIEKCQLTGENQDAASSPATQDSNNSEAVEINIEDDDVEIISDPETGDNKDAASSPATQDSNNSEAVEINIEDDDVEIISDPETGDNKDAASSPATQEANNSEAVVIISDSLPKQGKIEAIAASSSSSHDQRAILPESSHRPSASASLPVSNQVRVSRPTFMIEVKLMSGQVTLRVHKDDTVASLKEKLRARGDFPYDDGFQLCSGSIGRRMQDEKFLSDYKIGEGSTVHVLIGTTEPMPYDRLQLATRGRRSRQRMPR